MECMALTKIKIGKNQIPEKPRLRKFTRENKRETNKKETIEYHSKELYDYQ